MKRSKFFKLLLALLILAGCNQSDQARELELVGHRGAMGLFPENSIPGFKKAIELGANSIEFDVVVSGDNQVVVSHEPWFRHDICMDPEGNGIEEENQKEHLLYKMTYEEIVEYDCGSIQRLGFPDQQTQPLAKPLMREALLEVETFRQEQGYLPIEYNVEIKSNIKWDGKIQPASQAVVQLVYNELQELELLDRIKIFAFDTRILNTFRKIDSTLTQVYLIPGSKTDIRENLDQLSFLPDIYAPNHSLVDSALVEEVHSRGMRLIPWTVNDYEEMVRLGNLGVDGMISDYPNHFGKLRNHISVEGL